MLHKITYQAPSVRVDATKRWPTGSAEGVRVRRANAVVIEVAAGAFVIRHLIANRSIRCKSALLDVLSSCTEWEERQAAAPRLGAGNRGEKRLERLVDLGIMVAEGSEFAELDERYAQWEWGPVAATFHFGIKDVGWGEPEQIVEQMEALSAVSSGPALTTVHDEADHSVELPAVDLSREPYRTMRSRRSGREYGTAALELDAVARVLHAGVGVVEFVDAGPFGVLPLTMTPSGGARNPYECFVAARKVDGLVSGIYHYSATQHCLRQVQEELPPLGDFLGNIRWVDEAGALLLMVANFSRTMWKYRHPTAYRVVMLEAGHIAQNMLLAATAEGIASVPIAATNDQVVDAALGLDPLDQTAMHAVVLGSQP